MSWIDKVTFTVIDSEPEVEVLDYDDDEEWYFNMVPIPTKMETLGEAPWTSRS